MKKFTPAFLTLTMCLCDIATYNKYILRGRKFTFLFYFLIWTIFEVFIEFCFCFMFWGFWATGHVESSPQAGIETETPGLEGHVLTTGPPGKFLFYFINLIFK